MAIETDAPILQAGGWTYRYRPSPFADARLLLLLHGWTGDEDSMWIFAPGIPRAYAIVAPRAPYPDPEKGYSWRPLVKDAWGLPELAQLEPAAKALVEFLDFIPELHRFTRFPVTLMGFSQGAALSIGLTVLYPDLFSTAVVLSGFLPGKVEDFRSDGTLSGKEFLVAHGRDDKLVPIHRAQQAVSWLREAGAQVTYCESEGGHKVSAGCRRAVERFLADRLKD